MPLNSSKLDDALLLGLFFIIASLFSKEMMKWAKYMATLPSSGIASSVKSLTSSSRGTSQCCSNRLKASSRLVEGWSWMFHCNEMTVTRLLVTEELLYTLLRRVKFTRLESQTATKAQNPRPSAQLLSCIELRPKKPTLHLSVLTYLWWRSEMGGKAHPSLEIWNWHQPRIYWCAISIAITKWTWHVRL